MMHLWWINKIRLGAHTRPHLRLVYLSKCLATSLRDRSAEQSRDCRRRCYKCVCRGGWPWKMYYIPDDAFRNWWVKELKREPIPAHYVIPILWNMQGHPEAPSLWLRHIHKILTEKLKMNATMHEPCLYSGLYKNTKIYMIPQVNDFEIEAPNLKIA